MSDVQKWSLAFLLAAASAAASYLWFDQPISHFVHDGIQQYKLFERLTHIPDAITPLAAIAFVVLLSRALIGQQMSRFETVILLSGVSLAVTELVKNQLKFAFGRTWP